jgi:hypothetical protein
VHLEEDGQEVGNIAQDSVKDALDNNKQTVDDKLQRADKATEGEDSSNRSCRIIIIMLG